MNFICAFAMGQKVKIKDIDLVGTVVQIVLAGKNLFYKIEYWWEGQIRVVDQDEWQLEEYHDRRQ